MLMDTIRKYRDKSKYDLSCSETIIYAANEEYNLGLNEAAMKAMAPFSAGMYVESVCGAMAASLAVLGVLFTDNVAHQSEELEPLVVEFIDKFKNKLSSSVCAELKPLYRTEEEGCNAVIFAAGEVLQEIVDRELADRKA